MTPTTPSEPTISQPRPPSEVRVWNRRPAERPSPYQLYRQPDKQTTPESPRRTLRAQPTDPVARPKADGSRTGRRPPLRIDRPTRDAWQPPARHNRDLLPHERPQADRERPRDRDRDQHRIGRPGRVEPDSPRSGERQFRVPRADFRGPEAERRLKVIPREHQQRLQQRLQERLREHNRSDARPDRARLTRDVVGNAVPTNARLLHRDRISRISVGYSRIRRHFGDPANSYLIGPRSRGDYWDGYWDGYADGYWAGRHYRRHPYVVLSFYYPYYWSDPYWLAFHYPGYYPSIYHYWGWSPGWVYPTRVYYVPVEYVYVPVTPYRYYYSGYGIDPTSAQRAIEDIRRAWFNNEVTPLAVHLTDRLDVRIYFDGEYAYTTSTEDYYAMTVDAMATTETVAMDFDSPIWISTHEVFYTARHVFYDPSGERQTVYVSYRLRRLGGEWYIVAVGSSLDPIRHQYRDFRYS